MTSHPARNRGGGHPRGRGGRGRNRGRGGWGPNRGRGLGVQGLGIKKNQRRNNVSVNPKIHRLIPRLILPPQYREISKFGKEYKEEGCVVMYLVGDEIPLGTLIYHEDKTQIGHVCKIRHHQKVSIVVKLNEGIAATEFSAGQIFFDKLSLVPKSSFLPPEAEKQIRKDSQFKVRSVFNYEEVAPVYSCDGISSFLGTRSDGHQIYCIEVENGRSGNVQTDLVCLSRLHSTANLFAIKESEKLSKFVMEYGIPLNKFLEDNPLLDDDNCRHIILDLLELVESIFGLDYWVSELLEGDFFVVDSGVGGTERRYKVKYASLQKCKRKTAVYPEYGCAIKATLAALQELILRITNNVAFSPENEVLFVRFTTGLINNMDYAEVKVLKKRPFFWSFYKKIDFFVDFDSWLKRGNLTSFDNHTQEGEPFDKFGGKPFDPEGWHKCLEKNVVDYIAQGLAKKFALGGLTVDPQSVLPGFTKKTSNVVGSVQGGQQTSATVVVKKRLRKNKSNVVGKVQDEYTPEFLHKTKRASKLSQSYRNLAVHGQDIGVQGFQPPFKLPADLYAEFSMKFPALLDFCYEFARTRCSDAHLKEKYDLFFK